MKLDYSNSLKLRALIRKYEFERDQAIANLQVYFENGVGVGEHHNIVDSMDELMIKLTDAEGKLKTCISYFANITPPTDVAAPEEAPLDGN
jgi:hypothetical protein|tara:strand:+ start:597 stop:869 length:273 start_codon:yes stop_codon:yes gene_type:complete